MSNYIGHVAINTVQMATNQGFKSMVPDRRLLEAQYLYYWLKCHRPQLEALGNGATFKEVSKAVVSRVEIPVPPLPEQRRIAAILDQADVLRSKRRTALAHLDQLEHAIFIEMFGDIRKSSNRWAMSLLTDLCLPKQWPTITSQELVPIGYPVFGANGLIGYYSDFNHEQPTVLITCRGATCGTINVCPPKCYVTGNSMALDMPRTSVVDIEYLASVLRHRGLSDVITGSAQPQITRQSLSSVQIPLPPINLQKMFSERIKICHSSRRIFDASLVEIEGLFASLQHRAFTGAL